MRIAAVFIQKKTAEKILAKHALHRYELKQALLRDAPYFFRTRQGRYCAVGFIGKHLTIIFRLEQKIAVIVTAYPSSTWQKKLYLGKIGNRFILR